MQAARAARDGIASARQDRKETMDVLSSVLNKATSFDAAPLADQQTNTDLTNEAPAIIQCLLDRLLAQNTHICRLEQQLGIQQQTPQLIDRPSEQDTPHTPQEPERPPVDSRADWHHPKAIDTATLTFTPPPFPMRHMASSYAQLVGQGSRGRERGDGFIRPMQPPVRRPPTPMEPETFGIDPSHQPSPVSDPSHRYYRRPPRHPNSFGQPKNGRQRDRRSYAPLGWSRPPAFDTMTAPQQPGEARAESGRPTIRVTPPGDVPACHSTAPQKSEGLPPRLLSIRQRLKSRDPSAERAPCDFTLGPLYHLRGGMTEVTPRRSKGHAPFRRDGVRNPERFDASSIYSGRYFVVDVSPPADPPAPSHATAVCGEEGRIQ
mmetsp:Transcript_656/g.1808  ORF Transcript_656/g.1808 Transcript_656/m.1808 type:complete len:376 (-) Transcript_656:1990-3117(-)